MSRGRPLSEAAERPLVVERLIELGANVNCTGAGEYPPLIMLLEDTVVCRMHRARRQNPENKVIAQRLDSARKLITAGADVLVKGYANETILQLSAKIGNFDFFRFVCGLCAWDMEQTNGNQETLLHLALQLPSSYTAKDGDEAISICKMILNLSPNKGLSLVNAQDHRDCGPLLLAAQASFEKGIRFLIGEGADIHDTDKDGGNVINLLAREQSRFSDDEVAITKLLIESGVDCTLTDLRVTCR